MLNKRLSSAPTDRRASFALPMIGKITHPKAAKALLHVLQIMLFVGYFVWEDYTRNR